MVMVMRLSIIAFLPNNMLSIASSLILPFLFGIVIGSFLNVVALRFNTGVGIGGRSKCMSCGNTLTWKELIPLFSFLIQKGVCRKCKSKISWQYPLVEFIAGAVFALLFVMFPPLSVSAMITTVLYLIITCLALVMVVYDIKHKIIPDQFVFVFAGMCLLTLFIGGESFYHLPTFWQLIAGPFLATPFAFLWIISRGKWIGLGDAKLVLGIGWLLGIGAGINAIILAFWLATVISVLWIAFVFKKYKTKMEIPFGPYLILGMYITLFFGFKFIDINMVISLFKDFLL